VAGCCECGDEHSHSVATQIVCLSDTTATEVANAQEEAWHQHVAQQSCSPVYSGLIVLLRVLFEFLDRAVRHLIACTSFTTCGVRSFTSRQGLGSPVNNFNGFSRFCIADRLLKLSSVCPFACG
jgi:hypothetical protein